MTNITELAVKFASQVRCLKALFTPQQWDERMRLCRPVIQGRMTEHGIEQPLSAAVDLAREMKGDSNCPDMLPLLILAAGLELQHVWRARTK